MHTYTPELKKIYKEILKKYLKNYNQLIINYLNENNIKYIYSVKRLVKRNFINLKNENYFEIKEKILKLYQLYKYGREFKIYRFTKNGLYYKNYKIFGFKVVTKKEKKFYSCTQFMEARLFQSYNCGNMYYLTKNNTYTKYKFI